ncbi:AAA family ATPase [Candidatus Woesearchaeota archaeon]|nr:AAA family ATPase [Candidatus Woesearchaeota archaeon]
MIIGVTGLYASGKDTVADYLKTNNFIHYSLSDEIREEAKRRKVKLTRDNLINIGNELREKYGSSILAERVKVRIKPHKDYVITSIRNPEEVKALAKEENFILVTVTADPRVRFQRLKTRAREEDPLTFHEFVEKEKLEQSADPTKQQMHKTIKLAKVTIKNNTTIEELNKKTAKFLTDLRKKFHKRPSWDEYFIEISKQVAQRGTCDRGKSGCVIVKDKRILTTGYVGSAAGTPHCDDTGHLMKKVVHNENYTSQHCVRTIHAEQNAICQAARAGISLKGATVYCKMEPCSVCAKMIINCGMTKVVCEKMYHAAHETRILFKQTGVKLEILDKTVETYSNQ